jgi:hypothetical protein
MMFLISSSFLILFLSFSSNSDVLAQRSRIPGRTGTGRIAQRPAGIQRTSGRTRVPTTRMMGNFRQSAGTPRQAGMNRNGNRFNPRGNPFSSRFNRPSGIKGFGRTSGMNRFGISPNNRVAKFGNIGNSGLTLSGRGLNRFGIPSNNNKFGNGVLSSLGRPRNSGFPMTGMRGNLGQPSSNPAFNGNNGWKLTDWTP